jgi:acyl transferase domain-containing protein
LRHHLPIQRAFTHWNRLFSDEGRSFSFDSRGTGYGRGEGCGIVVLKSLDQALKDNDNVRSVIAASGINQDGKTSGITMPNGDAQGKSSLSCPTFEQNF